MAARHPPPKGIQAFKLSGAVPIESVGYVLKALYESGAGHLDIDPVLPLLEVTPNLPAPEPELKRLSPPNPKKRASGLKGMMYRSDGKLNLKAYLERLIYKSPQPINRAALVVRAAKAGYTRVSVHPRVFDLVRDGSITIDAQNNCKPTGKPVYGGRKANGAAKPSGGAAPDPDSINGITLAALKRAYPAKLLASRIATLLKLRGKRPEAASVALNWLKTKGLIASERPDPKKPYFLYQYKPQEELKHANPT